MMTFVLQTPSLQHLAAVKIVTCLWNQRDILTQIPHSLNPECIFSCRDEPQWLLINDLVEGKVSALPLPELCKKHLVNFIKPLGIEILSWCEYYNEDSRTIQLLDILLPPKLCWTMHGTVDYASTAKLIVLDEGVDLQKRFELACLSCFEDEARELFERLTDEQEVEWLSIVRYANRPYFSRFILLYTRFINLDVRSESVLLACESSTNKDVFVDGLRIGTRAMCEYLFHTLSPRVKEQVLEDCLTPINYCRQSPSRNMLYYLSLMNEEQQRSIHVFGEICIYDLLLCFLHWPLQSLFVETWKRGWQLMGNLLCANVLGNITRKISLGYRDYDYSRLFWECWRLMPANYASRLLCYDDLLEGLLLTRREEFMKLILNEVTSRQMLESFDVIWDVLLDESAISDAALMECKATVASNSSKDEGDEEKRLRSEYLTRLVDIVLERRIKRRKCPNKKDETAESD